MNVILPFFFLKSQIGRPYLARDGDTMLSISKVRILPLSGLSLLSSSRLVQDPKP